MSHDVNGTSASAETEMNGGSRAQGSQVEFVMSDSETETPATPVRVPVEVVIEGQDDSVEDASDSELAKPLSVERLSVEPLAVEPLAVEPLSVEPLSVDPAEEVAILLGEKSTADADQVDEEPQPTLGSAAPPTTDPAAEREPVSEPQREPAKIGAKRTDATEPAIQAELFEALEANEFVEMGLSPDVLSAIDTAGYETPSPIQSETVPYILEGRDLMGQAETGSGKTAAFAWPLLSKIDVKLAKPQVLVLAPTRELAIQVTAAFEKYARGINGFRAVTIYGGQSYETQLRALDRGVQVVVGTPGRVMDHLRRKTLDLRNLKTLVLDEADEMLRMGFIDDVEWILEQLPTQRQILSFSATLPPPIQRIAKQYLQDPAHVSIASKSATADSINQSCLFLHAREKLERLVRILQTEETDGVIVFVKTRTSTVAVSEGLTQRGIIASPLNGDIPQNQRERTVNQLKSGRINVVVATDVAARGLDVQRISHVINYDFPHDTEAYVHRIGRTGRAGRTGTAILFVEPKEKGKLGRLQNNTNQRIDAFKQKSIDEINELRVEKFKQTVVKATDDQQIKYFTKLVSDLQNETEIPLEKIAAAMAVLAQGKTPLLLKELANPKSNWKKSGKDGRRERGPMTTYRVEVGREHGVGPGNIVGAVTNEANLSNGEIGRINIFDRFSTIDLPSDMPQDLIDHLKHVHVSGQRLDISKSNQAYAKSGGRKSAPAHGRGGDRKFGGKKWSDKKPAGKRYGAKSFSANKPFEKNADRGPDRNQEKPAGKQYGTSPLSAKKPFERSVARGSDRTQEEKSASGRGPSAGKFGTKKPGKRKSNASGERTQLGEKRDRYARQEGTRPATGASKFNQRKPKPTPKTKAAERTKAKRKPGAKPSSPMKKYVKIRSAN